MAIVKMKRLRMAAMQSDREELLQLLQRMGCVEIDEPSVDRSDPGWAQLSRPDGAGLATARARKAAAEHALTVLKRYAPAKGGLLKARPVVSEQEFFNDSAYEQALQAAQTVNEGERRIAVLQAERGKLAAQRASLTPWLALDWPLDTASTAQVEVQLGTLPAAVPLEEVEAALLAVGDLAQLSQVSADREFRYLRFICHAGMRDGALEVLKEFGWSRVVFRDLTGTARDNDSRLAQEIEQINGQVQGQEEEIAACAGAREGICRAVDRAGIEINREEGKSRLLDTQFVFFLEGWVPGENWPELSKQLAAYPCAWETADPDPEEYPQVPVKLKNNWLTRPLNMVTEMYSLPAYGGLDPNPLMAPFFILFYGIMMADIGYGLLMILASVVVLRRVKPKGTMSHFFGLMGLCGVSTLIMGMVTGGFFGDFIPQLLKIINPDSTFVWFWEPLFTPLDDTLMVLVGSMALGFVQIITGMAISLVKKIQDGHLMDALMEEVAWWAIFGCIAGAVLNGSTVFVIAIVAIVVLTQGYGKKGIMGKVVGIFASLYNHVTGYFGDILSYSRLMALMLAGSVIAQVFNTLGAIPGSVIVFFVISMLGNALNFALNLLGCYVHDLRLQCLEYFGKFYQDGGKPFRPLERKTKYVDLTE